MNPVTLRRLLLVVFACLVATGCGAAESGGLSVGDDSISRAEFTDYASVLGFIEQGPEPIQEDRLDGNWTRAAARRWLTTSAQLQALDENGFVATADDETEARTVVIDVLNTARNQATEFELELVSRVADFDSDSDAFDDIADIVTVGILLDRADSEVPRIEQDALVLLEDASVESRVGEWDQELLDVVPIR